MYYIEFENKIVLADADLTRLTNTIKCMPQYQSCVIQETDRPIVMGEGEYVYADTPEYLAKELQKAKEEKLKENETVREQFLVSGVEYKDLLWDSDIEQKLNISVQLSSMSDEDTVVWVSMDGVTSLECTKQDLINIGALLTQMTAYVWQYKNPEIKTAINNAQTLEELDAIEIVYSLEELTVEPDMIEETEEVE